MSTKVTTKQNTKVAFIHSIKTKIVLLVIAMIALTALMNIFMSVPLIKKDVNLLTKNYMRDMAILAGNNIDTEMGYMDAEQVLTPEELAKSVADIEVSGMESSYAYVVSADGTMLYHPTADKIGQPVENAAVKQVLGELSKGNKLAPDVIVYDFKGVTKYASYYIGENSDYIVIVTADQDEAMESVNEMTINSVMSGVVALVICGLIGLFFSFIIVKPIIHATNMVAKLADLDFTDKDHLQKTMDKKKDETGVMGKAIGVLRTELADAVRNITGQSRELYEAASTMNSSAAQTVESVEQVEKAISEIAQGATSQAQETQTATENVIVMGNMIEEAGKEVESLRENAGAMRDAGNRAMEILEELGKINQNTKEAIGIIYEQTNTTNTSVLKIKEATDMITDIAEETNLLSLNASIEAARAGEQGRGFAVVAGQIQKLAEQSNESARQIADIINLLIADSEKTVSTMEDVKSVIAKQDEHVANTEKAFEDVKDGIDKSIESVRTLTDKTKQLDEARVKVVDVVQNLTAIAEENAASTEETSASASEVGAIMENISDNAKQLNVIADELKESISQFLIE